MKNQKEFIKKIKEISIIKKKYNIINIDLNFYNLRKDSYQTWDKYWVKCGDFKIVFKDRLKDRIFNTPKDIIQDICISKIDYNPELFYKSLLKLYNLKLPMLPKLIEETDTILKFEWIYGESLNINNFGNYKLRYFKNIRNFNNSQMLNMQLDNRVSNNYIINNNNNLIFHNIAAFVQSTDIKYFALFKIGKDNNIIYNEFGESFSLKNLKGINDSK